MPKLDSKLRKPFHRLSPSGKQKRLKILKNEYECDDTDEGNLLNDTISNFDSPLHNFEIEGHNSVISDGDSLREENVEIDDHETEREDILNKEEFYDYIDVPHRSFYYSDDEGSSNDDMDFDDEIENDINIGGPNSESNSASSNEINHVDEMKLFLKQWAITNNVPISTLSSLCRGLQNNKSNCFADLPIDGRTILKTPVRLNIQEMAPGHYIHIGLTVQLKSILSKLDHVPSNKLGLIFNIDGLPLFRSSSSELYPIMFSITNVSELKSKVFPVGLYYGEKKT